MLRREKRKLVWLSPPPPVFFIGNIGFIIYVALHAMIVTLEKITRVRRMKIYDYQQMLCEVV